LISGGRSSVRFVVVPWANYTWRVFHTLYSLLHDPEQEKWFENTGNKAVKRQGLFLCVGTAAHSSAQIIAVYMMHK
jgi:hypothetical protein